MAAFLVKIDFELFVSGNGVSEIGYKKMTPKLIGAI